MAAFDAALRDYFASRTDVEMAFMFGSRALGRERMDSDIDIAVYFASEGPAVEWETGREYPSEFAVGLAVEKITELETDLIVLNSCPSVLADTILREAETLAIRDADLHTRFLLLVSDEAERFRRDSHEVWDMKEDFVGYNDARRRRLRQTTELLRQQMSYRDLFVDMDRATYATDVKTRLAAERWVENLVNASIDAAKVLVAAHDIRVRQTYRDTLEALGRVPGFDFETADKLGQCARLRNVLAHEYLDVKYDQIREFLDSAHETFERFIDFLSSEIRDSAAH